MTAAGTIDPVTGGMAAPDDGEAVTQDLADALEVRLRVLDDVRGDITAKLTDAVTSAEIETTIEGASTLTLTVHDPTRALLRADAISQQRTEVEIDDQRYRLVRAEKRDDAVTLTFEDLVVNRLRAKPGAVKKYRDQITRAQFVQSMIREAPGAAIPVDIPELRVRQPVAKTTGKDTSADKAKSSKGSLEGRNLKVKGARMSRSQRRIAEAMLRYVDELYPSAPYKARLALMCAGIVESEFTNLRTASADGYGSYGVLQGLIRYHSLQDLLNVSYNVRVFMGGDPAPAKWKNGFTGRGGAIELARKHPSWTAGNIAQAVEGSAYPDRYDQYKAEAARILRAWNGDDGNKNGSSSRHGKDRYAFTREKSESIWDAAKRLAEEVGWRIFVVGGVVTFASEDYLMRSPRRLVITESDPAVYGVDFSIDAGQQVTQVDLAVHAARWDVAPGSVVEVREMGIADGEYLVSSARRSLFASTVDVQLKSLTAKLPEPAGESTAGAGGGGQGSGDSPSSKSTGERLLSWAKTQVGTTEGSARQRQYAAALGLSAGLPWCSIFVAYGMKKLGKSYPSNPAYSGAWLGWSGGKRINKKWLKPGDLVIYDWGNGGITDHVAIYAGADAVIGGNQTNQVSKVPAKLGQAVGIVRLS